MQIKKKKRKYLHFEESKDDTEVGKFQLKYTIQIECLKLSCFILHFNFQLIPVNSIEIVHVISSFPDESNFITATLEKLSDKMSICNQLENSTLWAKIFIRPDFLTH